MNGHSDMKSCHASQRWAKNQDLSQEPSDTKFFPKTTEFVETRLIMENS